MNRNVIIILRPQNLYLFETSQIVQVVVDGKNEGADFWGSPNFKISYELGLDFLWYD